MDNRQLVSVMSEISRRRVDVNDLGLALRAVAILTLESEPLESVPVRSGEGKREIIQRKSGNCGDPS
jgi:hypothetical protein